MKLLLSLLCVAFVSPCLAHMYLSSMHIGGQSLAEGDCVRLTGSNSPISSVTSNDMTCGVKPNSDKPANRKCPVTAGSKVGMQWYHEKPLPTDDIVDPSHRGPCTVYMAKNEGIPKWFKIYENGYDETTKKFCVDTLIVNRGYMEFTIPNDIQAGDYLIRGEIIALHQSYQVGGAQPYVGCGELTVSGSGESNPITVSLPGAYKDSDPGLYIPTFYSAPITNYVVPGPPVYVGESKGGSKGEEEPETTPKQGGKGMSAGGTAAVCLILIAFVGFAAVGVFYYHKHGHLFGYSIPSRSSNPKYATPERADSNYVEFVEEGQ